MRMIFDLITIHVFMKLNAHWDLFVLFIIYDFLVFSQFGGAFLLSIWIHHVDEKQCRSRSADLDLHFFQ